MASTEATPLLRADPWAPVVHRVTTRRRESADTITIGLQPVGAIASAAPAFVPGQFHMLDAFGVGEIAISISGQDRRGALLHTIRSVGAVSAALHRLRRDDVVGVRGPYGRGWDSVTATGDVVIVAGGLGLAPLRPAVRELVARRRPASPGRLFVLVGARSPADLLFQDELLRWARRPGVVVDVVVDHASPGWTGQVGLVTRLVRRGDFDPVEARALVCGPEPMMRFTVAELAERGIPPERVQLSLERNMHCGIGLCGHCQLGPLLLCRDGPVVTADSATGLIGVRER